MKKIYTLVIIALFIASCSLSDSKKETKITLKMLEEKIEVLRTSNSLETEKIKDLVASIEKYVAENKENSKTPELLEVKAKYLTALGSNKESLAVYEDIYNNYKSYKNNSDALFMMAFITENNIQDKKKAELIYKKYMAEFPNGSFYRDAVFSLENMYKTPEEMNEMFERMRKASESTPE